MGRDKDMIKRPGQANNFEQLFDEAPLPYQSLDKDGNFLKVNNAWLETLGYTKEEVIGTGYLLIKESERFVKIKRQNFIQVDRPVAIRRANVAGC